MNGLQVVSILSLCKKFYNIKLKSSDAMTRQIKLNNMYCENKLGQVSVGIGRSNILIPFDNLSAQNYMLLATLTNISESNDIVMIIYSQDKEDYNFVPSKFIKNGYKYLGKALFDIIEEKDGMYIDNAKIDKEDLLVTTFPREHVSIYLDNYSGILLKRGTMYFGGK